MSFPSVCLVVLDGWGLAPEGPGNAVALADTPVMDRLWATYPHARLRTSGEDVGLPHGQMGNSEVGHLNLGAGAVVKQDLLRIDEAVRDGSFSRNEALVAAMEGAERVHLVGLVSDDGAAEHHAETGEAAVRAAYKRGESDEFIEPTTVGAEARIRPGDSVVTFNFRPDRMRQMVAALHEGAGRITTLTQYEEDWTYPVAFPPARPAVTLPRVVARAGLRQLHVAETEKYPHVTYFFGGGEEEPEPGEDRALVPSPRDVPTYDHKPSMSAAEAVGAFVERWLDGDYGFGIINFANADMVGHTSSIPAPIEDVETLKRSLSEVVEAVAETGVVS